MESLILAARVILLRFIRLLISITIESSIYRESLNISPRRGVESALMINMFAEISGSIFFLFLYSLAPVDAFRHLVIYLMLENFQTISGDVFLLTSFYFILFLIAKWVGLLLLNMFVFEKVEVAEETSIEISELEKMNQWGSQFKTVIKAHTISYAVILFLTLFKIHYR